MAVESVAIQIANIYDERLFEEYKRARDAPRNTMADGVYFYSMLALEQYDALLARMGEGGDLEGYMDYHLSVTAAVQPAITQLQAAMTAITQIMQAIETAAPSTFNIRLPTPPPVEPEETVAPAQAVARKTATKPTKKRVRKK